MESRFSKEPLKTRQNVDSHLFLDESIDDGEVNKSRVKKPAVKKPPAKSPILQTYLKSLKKIRSEVNFVIT
jgi:hypothetical protein